VWLVRIAQLLIGALAFVVAVNLAILIYARTVTRLGEIAVRTALGASRKRILTQLFIEALALTAVGAAAGLVLAAIALGRLQSLILSNGALPFWVEFNLSVGAVCMPSIAALPQRSWRAAGPQGDGPQRDCEPAGAERPHGHAAGTGGPPSSSRNRRCRGRVAGGGLHVPALVRLEIGWQVAADEF
jgi:hypothetical protein